MKRIVALFFAFVSTIICSNAQNAQMQINFVDGLKSATTRLI